MSYRKMKKEYKRRYGHTIAMSFRDKEGRMLHNVSRKATSIILKHCLTVGKSAMTVDVMKWLFGDPKNE